MATYKVIQRGEAINLLYCNRTQMPIPLGVSVAPAHFNADAKKGKWINPKHPEADALNVIIQTRLSELKNHCNRYYLDHYKYPAPKSLKNFFTRGTGAKEFFELYAEFMHHKTHMGLSSVGQRTHQSYQTTLGYLKEYKAGLELADITPTFYDRFKNWLVKEKHLQRTNAVSMHIKTLKTFLLWLGEHHDIEVSKRTLAYMKAEKEVPDIVFNTTEELQKIIDADLSLFPHMEPLRDAYLIMCLTGLRISDYNTAEWHAYTDVMRKPAVKTREAINLPLHQTVQAIMDKYHSYGKQVPVITEQVFNRNLRIIGRLAGITAPVVMVKGKRQFKPGHVYPKYQLMTTHTARSTFICVLIKLDVHFKKIMKMTGIKSMATLKHYADAVDDSLQEAMLRVEEKQQLRITYKKSA